MLAEQVARAKVEGQEQLRHMLMIHVRVRSLNAHGQTIHSVHSRNPVTRRRSQTKRSRAKTNSSTTAPAGERAGFCTGPPRFATVRKVGDEVETFTASERGYGRGHKR
ncbi:unnamed protein product [Amoebophrya sp. A120]|nr:unnamed protein product [Amoebophrya sp. A120]|eukprot:GSA120T00021277001.1